MPTGLHMAPDYTGHANFRWEPHTPVGRVRREEKNLLSPVSLSVFSLVPDLLFDCSRLLEYAKIMDTDCFAV